MRRKRNQLVTTGYEGFRPDVVGSRLMGIRFLEVRQYAGTLRGVWLWQCDCGQTTEATPKDVLGGKVMSCGCARSEVARRNVRNGMRRKPTYDMRKQRWGKLTALHELPDRQNGRVFWMFRCECGKEKAICAASVRAGVISCGCAQRESARITQAINTDRRRARSRSRIGAGLLPHLMPAIKQGNGRLIRLMPEE